MPTQLTYRPDRFSRLFARPDARKLWAWLQQPENLTIMKTASYLHRPALEPLSGPLGDRFPQLLSRHAARQMAGHMVRQILEAQGFHLDRTNVKFRRDDGPFRRASSYTQQAQ